MLTDIKISTLEYNWNTKFSKHRKDIEKLLPNRREQIIDFNCHGFSAIANAIRRTVMDELETRAMFASSVETNDLTIIRDEIMDRIKFIPLQQFTTDKSETGSLYIHNKSDKIRIVKSEDIQNISGVLPGFRIAMLNPGDYIKIPEIKTKFGKGYENSCWTLSSSVYYDTNNYMDVHYINKRGNRPTQRVRVKDLKKYINKSENEIRNSKILIIRDKSFWNKLLNEEKARIELAKYDYKLFNEKSDTNFIPEIMSGETMPNSWNLKIQTHGNVDPKIVLRKILENILYRLTDIYEGNNVKYETITQITHSGPIDVNYMHIGETHTISELIIQNTYFMDPEIPLIKKYMNHPSEGQTTIIAIHSDFKKLINNSLDDLIKKYKNEIKKL